MAAYHDLPVDLSSPHAHAETDELFLVLEPSETVDSGDAPGERRVVRG